MAKTLLEFAAECARFSAVYKAESRITFKAAGGLTQKTMLASAKSTGWPVGQKKSGLGPIGITTRLLGSDAAEVRGRGGAAYAFEFGAKRHVIMPRRARAVHTTPYGWKAFVKHPGFRGRDYWNKGLVEAQAPVVKVIEAGVGNAMKRTFT